MGGYSGGGSTLAGHEGGPATGEGSETDEGPATEEGPGDGPDSSGGISPSPRSYGLHGAGVGLRLSG